MGRTEIRAGRRLRELRESLALSMNNVRDTSVRIASTRKDRRFIVVPSRLSEIERGFTVPNIFRVYTLARVYRVAMQKVMKLYLESG